MYVRIFIYVDTYIYIYEHPTIRVVGNGLELWSRYPTIRDPPSFVTAVLSNKFWSASHLYAYRWVMISLLSSLSLIICCDVSSCDRRPDSTLTCESSATDVPELQPIVPEERVPDDSGIRWYGLKYGWTVQSHFDHSRWDGECSVCGLFATPILGNVEVSSSQLGLRSLGSEADDPPTRFHQETAPLVRLVANDVFKCPAGSAISWWLVWSSILPCLVLNMPWVFFSDNLEVWKKIFVGTEFSFVREHRLERLLLFRIVWFGFRRASCFYPHSKWFVGCFIAAAANTTIFRLCSNFMWTSLYCK